MAINDPNYRYATRTFEADGIETQYEISFDGGYIRQSDVVAFSVLVDPETGLVSDRTNHPVVFLSEVVDPGTGWQVAQVEITPAVADGRRLVIYRSTQKQASLLDYQDGSVLTEKNLDLANAQAILAIAEIMDGLNAAGIELNDQVQQIIDIAELTETLYQTVLALLNSAGVISVDPLVFHFTGDGSATNFPIPGAAVSAVGHYDVYVAGLGIDPAEYTIVLGTAPDFADSEIAFVDPPANLAAGFIVLRGYAKPYTGAPPVTATDLRTPIIQNAGAAWATSFDDEFALIRCTAAVPVTVTVEEIPPGGDTTAKLYDGSYISFLRRGSGTVTITAAGGVTLNVPAGCLPQARAVGSVVTITCESADSNIWCLSGDLAKVP